MSKALTQAITSLFKKWIVERPHGMCQVLFALTELDDFVDEIVAEMRQMNEGGYLKGDNVTERGLYGKYVVAKADTMEVLNGCFVLRPEKDMAARHAILMYAGYVHNSNRTLADDLRAWVLSLPPLGDKSS